MFQGGKFHQPTYPNNPDAVLCRCIETGSRKLIYPAGSIHFPDSAQGAGPRWSSKSTPRKLAPDNPAQSSGGWKCAATKCLSDSRSAISPQQIATFSLMWLQNKKSLPEEESCEPNDIKHLCAFVKQMYVHVESISFVV